MANNNRQIFSPFFKDRYQIAYFRVCFGFPLQFVDNSFSSLKFDPLLEYGRQVLYHILFLSCFVYTSYAQMKRQQTINLMIASQSTMEEFGFAGLDMVVVYCLPIVNLISNSIYFISFKNNCTGLNKISISLTKINEEIYLYSGKKISGFRDSKLIGNKLFIILWVIMASCVGMAALCWSTMFNDSENVSKIDKIVFCLVQVLLAASYVYPAVAYSADMVITTLVYETKYAFDKLEILVKNWNTTKRNEGSSQGKPASFQDARNTSAR